jgi:acyl carrier protein
MEQTISDQVSGIIKRQFKYEGEIHSGMTAKDIDGWDSLGHALLLQALEQHFDIRFELDEIFGMQKVADIVETITRKLA